MYSQNNDSENYGKVRYERVINFDGNPSISTFNLFFNPDFSLFSETPIQPEEGVTLTSGSEDEFDVSIDVGYDGSKYLVLTDFDKKIIQSQLSLLSDGQEKMYIVEEDLLRINWEISDEYKMINDLKAHKAVGSFRGRDYIAWFTYDIPVQYGPWKLNGLPGLILNVSDSRNEVMFYAKEIYLQSEINSVSKNSFTFNSDLDTISLGEYVRLQGEQVEEVKKLFLSMLPKDTKVTMSKGKSHGLELEYEEKITR